ncbi:hypothetical protein WR25_11160 isoform C [Diploscapter pachys]|uniref:Hydroxylysine kinase n=1 Tax=Diploscapter pachys TaxID=2018661 RepID=A0A2A2JJ95_9BILA|nr:hypothetical protein WR25_11160 isoform C [Diploscapter pachys]
MENPKEFLYEIDEPTQCALADVGHLKNVVKEVYGIVEAEFAQLTGYEDCNFKLMNIQWENAQNNLPNLAILKITNPIEWKRKGHMDAQIGLNAALRNSGIPAPKEIPTKNGKLWIPENLKTVSNDYVTLPIRLFQILPGTMLENFPFEPFLVEKVGELLGKFHRITSNFDVQTTHVPFISPLNKNCILREMNLLLEKNFLSQDRFDMAKRALEVFEEELNLSKDKDFGIIHSDFNETNILIHLNETGDLEITGLLDFGDFHRAPRCLDVGAAILYLHLSDKLNQDIEILKSNLINGYRRERDFDQEDLILPAMKARLACSLIYGLRFLEKLSYLQLTELV